jgi:hypothetical protein
MSTPDSDGGFVQIVRRLLPFTSVLLVIAVLYVGWVFYSRWSAQRELTREHSDAAAERARADYELSGGSELKILALYATPGVVNAGQTSQLCYSVANAKAVSFEPKVDGVWPSRSRCVDISPKRDTIYVLTAQDDRGHRETAQIKVLVR